MAPDSGLVTDEMRRCIQECLNCHQVCTETLTYCIRQGGHHAEPKHLVVMMDCVEICRTSADFMMRGSTLHAATCRACAEVCERCAEDCARMADDAAMMRCGEACRRCAESCRAMSGAAA